ncbi:MAG: hypothetical protein OXF07_15535 [Rhodobacter sp.]|nr:hypothetical protein [Rhodobacter sp.]MCY4169559.1 hypothetical protein [Rhodobacter sp.]MCY4242070.1 hypothetical protein [Rhodobacter sp.]
MASRPGEGIDGTLVCAAECKYTKKGTDEQTTISGSWYFTVSGSEATTPKALYVEDAKTKDYVPRITKPYGEWGYWLPGSGDKRVDIYYAANAPGALELRDYRGRGDRVGPDCDVDMDVAGDYCGLAPTVAVSNRATYTGDAKGVSYLYGSERKVGAFDATATLHAQFGHGNNNAGNEVRLSGVISDFKGVAVNGDWELELERDYGTGTVTDGGTYGNLEGKRGEWEAQLYGEDGKRPTGAVGAFDGYFNDGEVVGGFHVK